MNESLSRRDALKQLGAVGAAVLLESRFIRGQAADIIVAGTPVEIAAWSLSATTVRITVPPIRNGQRATVSTTGALAREEPGSRRGRATAPGGISRMQAGDLFVRFTNAPPTIHVQTAGGQTVQRLTLSAETPRMSFLLPTNNR